MNKALVYHSISSPVERMPSNIDISAETFESHLEWLAKKPERVVPLENFLTAEENSNLVAITFDDGFQDNLTVALPLLEKYDLPMTLFIVYGFLGDEGYLTVDELKTLAKHPLVTIGSHGLFHWHSTELSDREALFEFRESKKRLEQTISKRVDLFAYPFGDCDTRTENICRRAGYRAAWSVWDGNNLPFSRRRIPLGTHDNLRRLKAKLSPFYFPIKTLVRPPKTTVRNENHILQPHR
jgi:peptidoglycan/xylan/chitin deacetylase (PgdA/CDA1 family)